MIENKKILAVVPARSGSKGVPRKNIRFLGAFPLIAYMLKAARQSRYIDRLVVSSDDDVILEIGRDFGAESPVRRPADIATDDTPLIAVVQHIYSFFKESGAGCDAVISLQPTCPFIMPGSIDKTIELWNETGCESVTTITEIVNGHPYIAKRLLADGSSIECFSQIPKGTVVGSRQQREKAYCLTGGIYLRDKRLLEKGETKGHCLGNDPRAIVVSSIEAVDINSELDFKFAEFLIQSGYITT